MRCNHLQRLEVTKDGMRIEYPLCNLNREETCKHRIVICPQLYTVCLPYWYNNDNTNYRKLGEKIGFGDNRSCERC